MVGFAAIARSVGTVLARVSGVARVVRAGAHDAQSRREQLVALTWAMRASVGRREALVQRQGRVLLQRELRRLLVEEQAKEEAVEFAQEELAWYRSGCSVGIWGQARIDGFVQEWERELLVRGRLLARVVRLRMSIAEALIGRA